jgi:hypothetical protein
MLLCKVRFARFVISYCGEKFVERSLVTDAWAARTWLEVGCYC